MKNISFSISLLLLSFIVKAQIINFPDANFKNALLTTNCAYLVGGSGQSDVDANDNGEIEVSEALDVLWLNLNGGNISNLSGLESFTNMTHFYIYTNPITSMELSTLSHLTVLNVNYTSITEINLCGTAVSWLWCNDNPNLQTLYLKNNIVSSDLAKTSQIPPPLHNFEFYNTPQLTYICYDDGEYEAVLHGLGYNTTGKTLTISCDAACTLSVESPSFGNTVSVYPNPTSGLLNIAVADNQPIIKTTINNVLGQTIMTSENSTTLDISSLTKGYYFITVETERGTETKKIIKL